MSILPNYIRSLVLTILLCFVAPIGVVTALFAALGVISYAPGLESAGQTGTTQVLHFLATFGSGCPVQGIMTIGSTCSVVGALFDTYAFYRYQSLNDH
ncbi:hypothetical protein [Allocoleopsis sp.]|uniref:hypothetical protein n=1 Tax=Allocoleopsis sp. TaxID=3088169 RepID=UPI002FD6B27B